MVTSGNSVVKKVVISCCRINMRESIVISAERKISLRTRSDSYKWGQGGISQTKPLHVHYS